MIETMLGDITQVDQVDAIVNAANHSARPVQNF